MGLDSPAPPYNSGAYDSSRCSINALDRELFKRRRRRRDPGLKSGHVADAGGDDVEQAMTELFAKGVDHYLEMKRIAAYAPDLGFQIAVDGLRNIPSKRKGLFNSGKDPPSVYKVITVVSPPGLFFQDPSVADDAQFTLKHDWEKPYNAPTFQDGFRRFRDKPASALVAVFEVRRFDPLVKGQTPRLDADDIFFAVLPILQKPTRPTSFLARKQYVDAGNHILPLFRGRCPRSVLDAADPYEAVTKCEAVPGASCVVRLVDAQSDAFDAPGPPYRLDRVEEICSALKLKKEAYSFPENDMEANVFRDKRLKKLVPRGDVETCEKVLNQVFAAAVGIRHYQLK